jgi:hypothetical protein
VLAAIVAFTVTAALSRVVVEPSSSWASLEEETRRTNAKPKSSLTRVLSASASVRVFWRMQSRDGK